MSDSRFWVYHALLPALVFAVIAILLERTNIDVTLSNHFYDFTTHQWPYKDSVWSSRLVHEFGRRMVVVMFLITVATLILSWLRAEMKIYRRPAAYMALVLLIAPGIVSIGKHTTNVDCPWYLDIYGGDHPYVRLFEDRPDNLPQAECFPGGHSSGGFALLGLYFLFLKRDKRLARLGLAIGLGVGGLFGLTQEMRGAHFLSHDVWSGFICWFSALAIYTVIFKQRLWPD